MGSYFGLGASKYPGKEVCLGGLEVEILSNDLELFLELLNI